MMMMRVEIYTQPNKGLSGFK